MYPLNERHLGEMNFKKWAKENGIDPKKNRVEPSELVIKNKVKKALSSYNFLLREGNGNTDIPGEVRLETGDIFFATAYTYNLIKQDSEGVNGVPRVSNTILLGYPDPEVFDGYDETLDVGEAECLEVFYGHGGRSELKEGGTIISGSTPLTDFRRDEGIKPYWDAKSEFEVLYPSVTLTDKSQFTLHVAPGPRDLIEGPETLVIEGTDPVETEPSTYVNYVVLRVRGYLVKMNGTTISAKRC